MSASKSATSAAACSAASFSAFVSSAVFGGLSTKSPEDEAELLAGEACIFSPRVFVAPVLHSTQSHTHRLTHRTSKAAFLEAVSLP